MQAIQDVKIARKRAPASKPVKLILIASWNHDLALLALGTGSVQLPLAPLAPHGTTEPYSKPRFAEAGFFTTLGTAAGAILDDPPDAATFAADLLLQKLTPPRAPGPRCVRLSPLVRPRWAAELARLGAPRFGVSGPPDASDEALFLKLRELEMDATDAVDVAAIVTLGEAWLRDEVTNQTLAKRTDGLPDSAVDWRAATAALRAWQNWCRHRRRVGQYCPRLRRPLAPIERARRDWSDRERYRRGSSLRISASRTAPVMKFSR